MMTVLSKLGFQMPELDVFMNGTYFVKKVRHIGYESIPDKRLCALLFMTVLVYLSLCFVILKKCCNIYGLFTSPNTADSANEELEQQSLLNTVSWWYRHSSFSGIKPDTNQGATSHLAFQGGKWAVTPTII